MGTTMKRFAGTQHEVSEWSFTAAQEAACPASDLELDVVFVHEGGGTWTVPAFWSGGREWRIRFAPPLPGCYRWRSTCSRPADTGLHALAGELVAQPCSTDHPLLSHGGIRVSADRRHFEHEDGTPFFWLADTWWMGLTRRLTWPGDFRTLAADRLAKGFSVVQIVAGLYPDMEWHDARGANEAGFPYDRDFTQVNPAYFDMADLRIQYLVRAGLLPCIVGCWGYFLHWMGIEKLKRHWRYLIARWGAYPVVWCLAGEGKMPYYLSSAREQDAATQQTGWTEIGRYVRRVDPMHRLVTIHPTDKGRDQVADDRVLDFDMLQTGHGGYDSIPNTVHTVVAECARTPVMPVIDGEVNYEGFLHGNYDEVQRLAFWSCVLSGAAGHTYGANGIWQVNTARQPYGPSPHGNTWGNRPWDEAMSLPGSGQLGLGKALLQRYRWWEFRPHQEWVEPAAGRDNVWLAYAAGIPGRVRVIYTYTWSWGPGLRVKALEAGAAYRAFFFNPGTGEEQALGQVATEGDGSWLVPQQPELRDWVLVLEAC